LCPAGSFSFDSPSDEESNVRTLARELDMVRRAIREEHREADRLWLCLSAVETVLVEADLETDVVEAQAQLIGKYQCNLVFLFHATSFFNIRFSCSFSTIYEQMNAS
jgi:hypothetical protein